jgi:S13-like H2TH domain
VLAERLQHVGVVDRGRVDYGGCPSSTRLTGTSSFRAGQGVRDSGHRMMLSGTWRGVFTGDDAQQAAFAAEAARAVRPRPVPPPRSGEQRKAALDAARQRNAELKALRAGLRTGELTLEELLAQAQSDHAAGRMPVRTAMLALPGIRSARASQVVAAAGIDVGRRVGALTTGHAARLLAAAAVDAELAARRGRRTRHASPVPRARAPG